MRLDDDIPASRPTLLMGQTKTVHNSLGCECPHGRTATERPYETDGDNMRRARHSCHGHPK